MLEKDVLHRDISLDNIMIYGPKYPKRSKDAVTNEGAKRLPPPALKRGLLIDVDYGILISKNPRERKTAIGHRTVRKPH
jgi:hypothetical protein